MVLVQLHQPGVVTVPGVILSEAKAFAVEEFQASYASVLLLDVFCSEGHEIHFPRFTIANKKPPPCKKAVDPLCTSVVINCTCTSFLYKSAGVADAPVAESDGLGGYRLSSFQRLLLLLLPLDQVENVHGFGNGCY